MHKLMLFIDGNNFETGLKELNGGSLLRIDYEKLAAYIAHEKCNCTLQRFYYYTAQGDSKMDPMKYASTQAFIDSLNKRVNKCIAKAGYLKHIGNDQSGKPIFIEKGTDVNIAIDMLSLAYNNAYDTAVLISADTDYIPVINMVRSYGKNVFLCVVDGQKAGRLKESCDGSIILTIQELKNLQRP